ncbi:MAG TPA: pyridoxamine 5'-phosphate oxidase [Cyclobacteriaceae bacterium]|nr:pyridoxamine 5'-phosphate oxidase [Cyclobacteriaceae bacterium]
MNHLASIRKEYSKAVLDIKSVSQNPIRQFTTWLEEALVAEVPEPNAMHLATVTESGRPAARIVLLKGVENDRFVFYTNYQSRKGKELDQNPACSLTFFWPELERQVRIEGVASRIDEKRSEKYFQSRPRGSQIGAGASPQSSMISDRLLLEERAKQMEEKFKEQAVLPKPNQWGGYEIDPLMMEFWQGRPSRLHDRILYTKDDGVWKINRLAP